MKIFFNLTHRMWAAGVILILSASITLWMWQISKANLKNLAREQFEFRATEIVSAIQQRMQAYEQILRGGIGLFAASEKVSREEWKVYVNNLKIQENYPGISGIGFCQRISSVQVKEPICRGGGEAFFDYTIRSGIKRSAHTPPIYLEPTNRENQQTFEYDLSSEPVLHVAMEHARDTGKTTLSGKISLVDQAGQDTQAGFLIFLPLYRKATALETVEQRREAIQGYVYGAIRMHDMISKILGRKSSEVHLQIYDGQDISPKTKLYDSDPPRHRLEPARKQSFLSLLFSAPDFIHATVLTIEDHLWTLHLSSLASSKNRLENKTPDIILICGSLMSLLLFGFVGSLTTTRERALALAHRMTKEIQESERRLREITSTLGEGVYVQDKDGRIVFVNPEAQRLLGWSAHEMLGQNAHGLLHYHTGMTRFPSGICPMLKATQAGEGYRSDDDLYRRKGDTTFSVAVIASPILRQGEYVGTVVAFRDITEHKQTELALRESQRFRVLFEYALDLLFLIEPDGRIVDANRLAYESLGIEYPHLIGSYPSYFIRHVLIAGQPVPLPQVLRHARSGESLLLEAEFTRQDGRSFPIEALLSPIEYERRPLLLVAVRDITERKQAEEKLKQALQALEQAKQTTERINQQLLKANQELHRLSHLDGLTGIANRRYFDEYLAKEWRRALRTSQPISMILIDVDHFKKYNDHYGHQTGDDCLRQIAHRLSEALNRPADLLARYGGEEFVAILPETTEEGALYIAENMRTSIEALKIPHAMSPLSPHVTLSVGVATLIANPNNKPESLIEAADQALYQAKNTGRNRVNRHNPQTSKRLA